MKKDDIDKNKLFRMLGHNLKIAREMNGISRKMVMRDVFGTDGDNLNRISEIENGLVSPPIAVLLSLSSYYNVSMDFVFGRTNNAEFLSEDAYVGRAVTSIRSAGIDMMDKVTKALLEQVKTMPKASYIELLEASKGFSSLVLKGNHNLKDDELKKSFLTLHNSMLNAEKEIARNQVLAQVAYEEILTSDSILFTDN